MHISAATIASSTKLASSVVATLTSFFLQFLVITIGVAVGIFFLYWALRQALHVHIGVTINGHEVAGTK